MITNPKLLARHRQIVANAEAEYGPLDEIDSDDAPDDYPESEWRDDTRSVLDRFAAQYGEGVF